MLKYLLGCACAVAMTHAARAEECKIPLATFITQVQAGAAAVGDGALVLEGDQAKRFLAYANTKVGDPTDYTGDTVVIRIVRASLMVLVATAKLGCVTPEQSFRLGAKEFMDAYKAAHGEGV